MDSVACLRGNYMANIVRVRVPIRFLMTLILGAYPARVSGHTEATHSLLTLLSLDYLAHRAAKGDEDAKATKSFITDLINGLESNISPSLLIHLGIEPTTNFIENPERQEPGLSGWKGAKGGPGYPPLRGALLGYLTAQVDSYTDFFGDMLGLFHVARGLVDDRVGNIGDDVFNTVFTYMAEKPVSWSCSIDHFWEFWKAPVCVAAVIVGAILGSAAAAVSGGVAYVADSQIKEMVIEDLLSGCDSNVGQNFAVDQLVKEGLVPSEEAKELKDGSAFWNDIGIGYGPCDEIEEGLEHIGTMRFYGTPKNLGGLIKMLRARLAGVIWACDAEDSGEGMEEDAEDCADSPEKLQRHFLSLPIPPLVAETLKRVVTGKRYDKRLEAGANFSSLTHFADVFSTHTLDTTPPDFTEVGVDLMKEKTGIYHSWDGFSLEEGKPFRVAKGLIFPGLRQDDDVLYLSRTVNLSIAEPSFWLLMRRRVCRSDDYPNTLHTSDGLGGSECDNLLLLKHKELPLPGRVFPPAELLALDGWSMFVDGWFPPWQYGTATYPTVPPIPITFGPYLHFNFYYPFEMVATEQGSYDYRLPILCQDPVGCDDGDLAIPAIIDGWQAREMTNMHTLVSRLRGLAMALHSIHDMTVPHHLAPTLSYGHEDYESWFADYLWPLSPLALVTFGLDLGTDTPGLRNIQVEEGIESRWGVWTGAPESSLPSDPQEAYKAIVRAAEHNGFFDEVDFWFEKLRADMAQLVRGKECEANRFAVRRLVRAVIYETAKTTYEASSQVDVTPWRPVSEKEKKRDGFFVVSSALASLKKSGIPGLEGKAVGHPVWKEVADTTSAIAVAAGALLLEAARKAYYDPTSTCDGGGADLASPPSEVQPLSSPGCVVTYFDELQRCFGTGNYLHGEDSETCKKWKMVEVAQKCMEKGASLVYDVCGPLAAFLASCACRVGGVTRETAENIEACAYIGLIVYEFGPLDLYKAGKIDLASLLLDGQDSDDDGIVDSVDRCPNSKVEGERIGLSRVKASICTLDLAKAGLCQYGCPLESHDERCNKAEKCL